MNETRSLHVNYVILQIMNLNIRNHDTYLTTYLYYALQYHCYCNGERIEHGNKIEHGRVAKADYDN